MSNTDTHTPTPWGAFKEALYTDVCQVADGEHGGDVCTLYTDGQEANARHIVKCVNAHDELLAALKGLLVEAERLHDAECTERAVKASDWDKEPCFDIAEEAIKKAEGKS